jgi:hypothetical protein
MSKSKNLPAIIKLGQEKRWPGIIPIVKSILYGSDYLSDVSYDESQTYVNASMGAAEWFRFLTSNHTFNRKALNVLVETGYVQNPAVFGMINKILLAQRNIKFVPYWKGKPYLSKKFNLDANFGLQMLLLTGTCIVYNKEIVGFQNEPTILNTLDIEEIYLGNKKFVYRLHNNDGSWTVLDNERMIFIIIFDPGRKNTKLGLSPLQAALMPNEAMREMYIADTCTLKNKGVDVLITNDSDQPLIGQEQKDMDKELNDRIGGARRSGGVATSTAKLRVLNLGRSAKDLALWDGYKIKLRDLCNVFQVDSGQFNDPDNKKFANVEESNRALYNDCVIPFTKLITENKELVSLLGFEIYLDTSGVDCLQESQKIRAEKAKTTTEAIVNLNKDVKAGSITRDIAVKILVSEWGFDKEEAEMYIAVPEPATPAATPPAGDPQPIAE